MKSFVGNPGINENDLIVNQIGGPFVHKRGGIFAARLRPKVLWGLQYQVRSADPQRLVVLKNHRLVAR